MLAVGSTDGEHTAHLPLVVERRADVERGRERVVRWDHGERVARAPYFP